jgi:hypothetical protein
MIVVNRLEDDLDHKSEISKPIVRINNSNKKSDKINGPDDLVDFGFQ